MLTMTRSVCTVPCALSWKSLQEFIRSIKSSYVKTFFTINHTLTSIGLCQFIQAVNLLIMFINLSLFFKKYAAPSVTLQTRPLFP